MTLKQEKGGRSKLTLICALIIIRQRKSESVKDRKIHGLPTWKVVKGSDRQKLGDTSALLSGGFVGNE